MERRKDHIVAANYDVATVQLIIQRHARLFGGGNIELFEKGEYEGKQPISSDESEKLQLIFGVV